VNNIKIKDKEFLSLIVKNENLNDEGKVVSYNCYYRHNAQTITSKYSFDILNSNFLGDIAIGNKLIPNYTVNIEKTNRDNVFKVCSYFKGDSIMTKKVLDSLYHIKF
jgi:hypothetical protein